MGNIQTNKVDNIQKRNGPETEIRYELASASNVMQINRENIISEEVDNEYYNNKLNSTVIRYLNPRNLEAKVKMITWYRDSHGLFDYEEQNKITRNEIITDSNCKQSLLPLYFSAVILKRENENVVSETFEDFSKMRANQDILRDLQKEAYQRIVASCFFKDNNFWIFHKETIEDSEEEKANPGDKLWVVLRHMQADKDHNYVPNKGYKLELGDTVKFGRVRYKVILMQNEKDGKQEYALFDRFQKKKHLDDVKKLTGYVKKRSNSLSGVAGTSRSPSPMHIDGSPQRAASMVAIPRYQSQQTQFENGAFDRESFYQGESISQDMGDSDDESSNYTGSQGEVSERDEEDGLSDVNTVQQNGSMIVLPMSNREGESEENSISIAMKSNGPNLSFALNKFNSVAPVEVDSIDRQNSQRDSTLKKVQEGQPDILDRRISHQTGIRDIAGLGKTSVFFQGNNGQLGSYVSNGTEILPRNLLEAERQRKRNRKNKKNQKQKQQLKLQLAERAKLAMDGKVCRICLGEENETNDPLISPCKCAGTMSHIHLECLREWLNSKRSRKDGEYVKTYCWKALECELCQQRFPGQVFQDGTIVSDKIKLSQKQIKKLGKPIEILDFDKPDSDYIVIESERQFIRVGRGHDADIRVTDISVSRFHAKINRSEDGSFYVEDNKSKFGTLIQVRKPMMLDKNRNNYIQMGRSTLQIRIDDDYGQGSSEHKTSCCSCFLKSPIQKQAIKEISRELYPKEWNPEVSEEEDPLANTQIIEQTVEGEEEGEGNEPEQQIPEVQVIDMELGEIEEEEQKDNQIVEQNVDNSILDQSNVTPFLVSDKAHGALAGMQTGLEKSSVKALDLQQDFGGQGNAETSLMDNSLNDTTQLISSPQKQQVDMSRNQTNPMTNLITPIKEIPEGQEENEPESQEQQEMENPTDSKNHSTEKIAEKSEN